MVGRIPIDIRDVIRVPSAKLAAWGYVEYLPGWFAPGPELTNAPAIPAPRFRAEGARRAR